MCRPRSLGTRRLSTKEERIKALLDAIERLSDLSGRLVGRSRSLPVLQMPATRAGCAAISRPCPFVRCSMNNYLDVTEKGAVKLNFPDLVPGQVDPRRCCALDGADQVDDDERPVDSLAKTLNLGRSRTRKMLTHAVGRFPASLTR